MRWAAAPGAGVRVGPLPGLNHWSCRVIAVYAGYTTPDAMRHRLGRAPCYASRKSNVACPSRARSEPRARHAGCCVV